MFGDTFAYSRCKCFVSLFGYGEIWNVVFVNAAFGADFWFRFFNSYIVNLG